MKILVVEDEIYSRRSLVKQIRELDKDGRFEILEASNGRQGLEMFRSQRTELVLTDIRMPFLSGLDLLRSIAEENLDTRVVMISGYAEFNYAREALKHGAADYLLKPVKDVDLRQILGEFIRHSEERREQGLMREDDSVTKYIYRHISAGAAVPDYVGDSAFTRIFPSWHFLCVSFSDEAPPGRETFYRLFRKLRPRRNGVDYRMIRLSAQLWGVVLKDEGNIRNTAQSLMEHLMGYDCCIGVSGLHTNADTLREACGQAQAAVKSRLFQQGAVFFFEELSKQQGMLPRRDDMELLQVYLEKGDGCCADALVRQMMDALLAGGTGELPVLEGFLMRLSSMCHEIISSQKNWGDSGGSVVPEFPLLLYRDSGELIAAVSRMVKELCASQETISTNRGFEIAEQVLRYIDRHYDQDFSLKYLAEQVFFINHTYLSHLISERTGVGFTQYLQQVRMKKAKELLANRQLSITQVAALSGYNDTSHFIQVFKKHMGATPKKFRDQNFC